MTGRVIGETAGSVRVGIVDYLNSRPLAWDFLCGRAPAGFVASYDSPAGIADRLRDGELDIGLLPSIELQRISGLCVIPGSCVAAQEEVRSVLLIARVPIEKITRVALDHNSRTSAALVRIVLSELHECRPVFESARPRLEEMLETADAALLIGDPALRVASGRYVVLDLAREWRRLTGLPFVFAVWAARRGFGLRTKEVIDVFRSSRDHGLRARDQIAAEAAQELDLEREELEVYLKKNLSYHLGGVERQSLVEFHRRAAESGLIESAGPICYLEEE